jgi:hypothetical protein
MELDEKKEVTNEAGRTLEQGRPPSGSSRIFASISAFPSPAATKAHRKAWFKTGYLAVSGFPGHPLRPRVI